MNKHSELKAAVDLVNAERDEIGIAAGMNNRDAALLMTAYNLYVQDKDSFRARELINAAMNWLAATGRAEGISDE